MVGNLNKVYDALVRFVDADVEPGKTYAYAIRVRMHNPNFGKPELTAEKSDAEVKEKVSQWVTTPTITIPDEYHLYAVDQSVVDLAEDGKKPEGVTKARPDQAVFQIHRWVKTDNAGTHPIADWAIAERLLVRRGEPIGSQDLIVEMPTWNILRGGFELLGVVPGKAAKRQKNATHGVPIDFLPKVADADGKAVAAAAPYLVDFDGGKQVFARPGMAQVIDESVIDALILTPDGKLIRRNARADADTTTEAGKERQDRVTEWRRRVNLYLNGGPAPGGPGAAMPGVAPMVGP
jgi:hypothetical protein